MRSHKKLTAFLVCLFLGLTELGGTSLNVSAQEKMGLEQTADKQVAPDMVGEGLKDYTTGATTVEEVTRRLNEIKAALPDGTYFTTDGKPCEHKETAKCLRCFWPEVSMKRLNLANPSAQGTGGEFILFVYHYLFRSAYSIIDGRMSLYQPISCVAECKFADFADYAFPGDLLYTPRLYYPLVYMGQETDGTLAFVQQQKGTKIKYLSVPISFFAGQNVSIYRNNNYAEALAKLQAETPSEPSGETPSQPSLPKTVKDTKEPVIRDIRIENITEDGFDVSCIVNDDQAVGKVKMRAWHADSAEERETAYTPTKDFDAVYSEGRYICHINRSDFEGKYGIYHTTVLAYDLSGNWSFEKADTVSVGTLAQEWGDTVSIEISDITPCSFRYIVQHKDIPISESKQIQISYETWAEEKGKDYEPGSDTEDYKLKYGLREMATYSNKGKDYLSRFYSGTVVDKLYGFSKTYHVNLSVSFSDGSVVNKTEIINLPEDAEPFNEVEWNDHIYKVFWGNLTWEEAERACEEMGGHLVTINSKEENDFITKAYTEVGKKDALICSEKYGVFVARDWYYTGGKYDPQTKKVTWITGEEGDVTDWKENWTPSEDEDAVIVIENTNTSIADSYGIWDWGEKKADSRCCGYICEIDDLDPVVNRLKISEENVTLEEGKDQTITANLFPYSGEETIVLESADPTIVSVEGNTLKAVGSGETDITVTDLWGSFRKVCHVAVKKAGTQKPDDTKPADSGKEDSKKTPDPGQAAIPDKPGSVLMDAAQTGLYIVTSKEGEVPAVKIKESFLTRNKTLTIPDTIMVEGVSYQVTSIMAGAFKDHKKLTKVTIGANVKSIGRNAFSGCKKLKTVIFKTKVLKSIGKKAFTTIKSGASFKCPKKKAKDYKKMLKKSGLPKKAKIR